MESDIIMWMDINFHKHYMFMGYTMMDWEWTYTGYVLSEEWDSQKTLLKMLEMLEIE